MAIDYRSTEVVVYGDGLSACWTAWEARKRGLSVTLVLAPTAISKPALSLVHGRAARNRPMSTLEPELQVSAGPTPVWDPWPLERSSLCLAEIRSQRSVPKELVNPVQEIKAPVPEETEQRPAVAKKAPVDPRQLAFKTFKKFEAQSVAAYREFEQLLDLCLVRKQSSIWLAAPDSLLLRRLAEELEASAVGYQLKEPVQVVSLLHLKNSTSELMGLEQDSYQMAALDPIAAFCHRLQRLGVYVETEVALDRIDLESERATLVAGGRAFRGEQLVLALQADLSKLGPQLPDGRWCQHPRIYGSWPDRGIYAELPSSHWIFRDFTLHCGSVHPESGEQLAVKPVVSHVWMDQAENLPDADPDRASALLNETANQWRSQWFPSMQLHKEPPPATPNGRWWESAAGTPALDYHSWRKDVVIWGGLGPTWRWLTPGAACWSLDMLNRDALSLDALQATIS